MKGTFSTALKTVFKLINLTSYFIDFDFIVLPYALRKNDIQHIKDVLGPAGAHIHILAKVNTIEALRNYEELV